MKWPRNRPQLAAGAASAGEPPPGPHRQLCRTGRSAGRQSAVAIASPGGE